MDTKDIYLLLTSFVDDKSVVRMLSVNRKFNDPEFFRLLFSKRYPNLIKFKKKNEEDWKQFYLNMIYWISKLEEDFHYNYIDDAKYKIATSENPKEIYNELIDYKTRLNQNIKLKEKLEYTKYDGTGMDVTHITEDGRNVLTSIPINKFVHTRKVKGYNIFSDKLKSIITIAKLLGDYRIISLWDSK